MLVVVSVDGIYIFFDVMFEEEVQVLGVFQIMVQEEGMLMFFDCGDIEILY